MKKKSYLYSFLFVFLFLVTFAVFYWFIKSPYFSPLQIWVSANKFAYILILYFVKTIGILWPPIPAGLFTMASIPLIGWQAAYLVDLGGSISGGSIAYYLGKKYGIKFLNKIFDASVLKKIKSAKIKKGKEIEAVFVYRVLLGTTILEAIYYGAGFLKINFRKFLIGAILSHIVTGIPGFILAQNVFGGNNILITIISIIVSIFIVYKTKTRYFE